jgi:hypothetical protein
MAGSSKVGGGCLADKRMNPGVDQEFLKIRQAGEIPASDYRAMT